MHEHKRKIPNNSLVKTVGSSLFHHEVHRSLSNNKLGWILSPRTAASRPAHSGRGRDYSTWFEWLQMLYDSLRCPRRRNWGFKYRRTGLYVLVNHISADDWFNLGGRKHERETHSNQHKLQVVQGLWNIFPRPAAFLSIYKTSNQLRCSGP